MDQDYHYYATYLAAQMTGWSIKASNLMARASNYVDFFSEKRFRGYWDMEKNNKLLRTINYPRYTFQANYSGNVVGAEGLWSAFHFLPGNYVTTRSSKAVKLPDYFKTWMSEPTFKPREEMSHDEASNQWRLTRPLSTLSRAIITDTFLLAKDMQNIRRILVHGPGLEHLIDKGDSEDIEKRFLIILTGIRAHVIGDTWAHQDFAGIPSVLNTYYDINGTKVPGKYGIEYKFPEMDTYRYQVLGRAGQDNPYKKMPKEIFMAPPALGKLTQLGHGWMSHLPDYSFISYRYRPCWKKDYAPHERINPAVYLDAFYDMLYFLHLVNLKTTPLVPLKPNEKNKIQEAIRAGWNAGDTDVPRVISAKAWDKCIGELGYSSPVYLDTRDETGNKAALNGEEKDKLKYKSAAGTAYGTFTLQILSNIDNKLQPSDFYLFQLAADYHFQYVKSWLLINRNHELNDSWSEQPGPLGGGIQDLTNNRVEALN